MFKHLWISSKPCTTTEYNDEGRGIGEHESHELKVEVSQTANGPRNTIIELDCNLLYRLNEVAGFHKDHAFVHAVYTADGLTFMPFDSHFEGPAPLGIATVGPHIHELKSWPEHYNSVVNRVKTFEMRRHDRPFMPGDLLQLKEYRPEPDGQYPAGYTGRYYFVRVTSVTTPREFAAIPEGFCILSIQHVPDWTVLL